MPKDDRGDAQTDSKNPGKDNNNRCLFNSALVLDPNWKHDGDAAVDTDDDQEEDAAEHVEEHNSGGELAHEVAEDPIVHHHLGDVKRQEAAEDEVRDGEAQVPGGVDRLLHLEASNPDDQAIPNEAQQKNEHTDHQQRHTQAILQTLRFVLKNQFFMWCHIVIVSVVF